MVHGPCDNRLFANVILAGSSVLHFLQIEVNTIVDCWAVTTEGVGARWAVTDA